MALPHRTLSLAVAAAFALGTLALTPAPGHSAPPPKLQFADSVTAPLAALFDTLAAEFTKAVTGDAAAEAGLAKRAPREDRMANDLGAFLLKVGQLGEAPERIVFTGFEVQATVWYGMVPFKDVEVFYWLSDEGPKVLRMETRGSTREVFDGKHRAGWRGEEAMAALALTEQVLGAAASGRCETVPTPGKADYEVALPAAEDARKKSIRALERFRFMVLSSCARLKHATPHRVTLDLGDVAGVLHGKDGGRYSFRMQLARLADGTVGIANLRQPVAPR